mgnify:CR=1 FL=1
MKRTIWHRTYNTILDDERMLLLSSGDKWHYVELKCLKSLGVLDKGDPVELLRRKVAARIRVEVPELEKIASRLAEVGLIDPETFQPIGWDEEQFVSDRDPTAAERKRRQRARERSRREEKQERKADACEEAFNNQLATSVTNLSRVTGGVTGTGVTRTDTEPKTDTDLTTTTLDWSLLPNLSADDRREFISLVPLETESKPQDLLDEMTWMIRKGQITHSWQRWLQGVIKNGFVPNHCREIQAERRRRLAPKNDPLASPETPYERDLRLVEQEFRYEQIDAAELDQKRAAIRDKYGHSTLHHETLQ